jgi:putative FmdB family regulatory protein
MPVYAYHCRSCDQNFEVKQSFNDIPLRNCVLCETPGSVHRIIQPAGIVFKGSGWYVTDSKGASSGTTTSTKSSTSAGDNNTGNANGSYEKSSDENKTIKGKATAVASESAAAD